MGCGCKDRAQAIADAALAIADGNLSEASRQAGVFVDSAKQDLQRIARSGTARLGAMLGGRR